MFSNILMSLAEFSHLLSLSAILICATLTCLYILRLIQQDWIDGMGGVTRVGQAPPRRWAVNKIPLPYAFSIDKDITLDRVKLNVTTQDPWKVDTLRMRMFIGVSIPIYYHVLKSPWSWFKEAFEHGNMFGQDGCLEMTKVLKFDLNVSKESTEVIACRQTDEALDLGSQTPRERYPIVICSMPDDLNVENVENVGHVGAMFHVIHIRDGVCQFPTQILSTHLKLLSGHSITLGPLFVSGEQEEGDFRTRCVVCQDFKVTRVIFPCRHACVCSRCFPRLKNQCPMCRNDINSYFLLEEEEEEGVEDDVGANQGGDSDSNNPGRNWRQTVANWNRSFALAMGLQEN